MVAYSLTHSQTSFNYRLVNGENLTTKPEHMWLTVWDQTNALRLTVTFPNTVDIAAISIWNYNASEELSYSGNDQFCTELIAIALRKTAVDEWKRGRTVLWKSVIISIYKCFI